MGRNLGRPFDKHIDDHELNALVPSSWDTGQKPQRLSPRAVREAEHHVESCADCSRKVLQYRDLVNRLLNAVRSKVAPPETDCPQDEHVDWHELAAGLWPELKARQLIMHAALCDHCGPLLRAATSASDDATPQEEEVLRQLKAPSRPPLEAKREAIPLDFGPPRIWRRLLHWKIVVPAVALVLVGALLQTRPSPSKTLLSGTQFAELAVRSHRQHAQGSLSLDVHTDSEQRINEWLKGNSQFALVLPTSPAAPGEERPYRLDGARLVQVGGNKIAAYIAYQLQTGPASLMVAPDSVAVASGGIQKDFTRVSFHYSIVAGYRVVTWSVHGLTYALVSQEANNTQHSCMVCHSAMRDRDLSQAPTPFGVEGNHPSPMWQ